MPQPELLIHHRLSDREETSLIAALRANYRTGEMLELDGELAQADAGGGDGGPDPSERYWSWYGSLTEEEQQRLVCVTSPAAHHLMPALERRPFRAFCLLRDPVEAVWSRYCLLRRLGQCEESDGPDAEIGRTLVEDEWSLADVFLELGGGGPRMSPLHGRLRDFFNGQTRSILAPWRREAKLEYWAGIPERGAASRDEALEILTRHYVVGVHEQLDRSLERFAAAFGWDRFSAPQPPGGSSGAQPDPRTRLLILAHNELDAELHAHFSRRVERARPQRRLRPAAVGAVCVLGMARSGTSLTTRIVNLLGVDLGDDEGLMEPAPGNNPAGFWEHQGIADLNEEILATLGDAPRQRWRWPPPLPQGWEKDPRLEPHRRAAESVLRRSFAARPLWGWKDPRTCLTLPFWHDVLGRMNDLESRLRYVICVRHPVDVADSLAARDGLGREEAVQLWLRYMSRAIVHTRGGPRVFVSYEGYFGNREAQVAKLAELIGGPAPSQAQRRAIAAHLDDGLWHHREAATTDAELPPEAEELYALLCRLCEAPADGEPAAEAGADLAARRLAGPDSQA